MKKTLAILLAMTLMFSMSSTVLAAGSTTPGGAVTAGNTSGEVTVTVTGVVDSTDIYYVIINWNGGLNFTYNFAETSKVWNPEKHDYDVTTGNAGWNATSANIVVTNHSSKAITAIAEFSDGGIAKTVSGVTATITTDSASVAAPVVGSDFNAAPTGTLTVSITDNAPSVKEGFTIGTIKVSIS